MLSFRRHEQLHPLTRSFQASAKRPSVWSFRSSRGATGRNLKPTVARLLIDAVFGSLVEFLQVQETRNLFGRVSLGYLRHRVVHVKKGRPTMINDLPMKIDVFIDYT